MGKIIYIIAGLAISLPARAAVITNLGLLAGETQSAAANVNDAGVVVGAAAHDPGFALGTFVYQGFRWTEGGGIQSLGSGAGIAYGINSSGTVVGTAGYRYIAPGPAQHISGASDLRAINGLGVMVGKGPEGAFSPHAYRFDGMSAPQDLGVIGGSQSFALDINSIGTIVGWSNISTSSSVKKAFRYVAGGPMQAISGLSSLSDSSAEGINDAGDIVGWGPIGTGAFRYTAAGALIALPGPQSAAYDINDAGFVVGRLNGSSPLDTRAALWWPNNTLVDLNQWLDTTFPADGAKWTLNSALGLNNSGLVVGTGQYNDGVGGLSDGERGFVLNFTTLVPEPVTALILPAVSFLLIPRRR